MTPTHLLLGGLLAALVVTNVYWHRLLATVRDGLRTAEEWEATDRTDGGPGAAFDGSLRIALEEAADTAGVPIDDLPERVETYEERAREHAKEVERLREAWVDSWWAAATSETIPTEGPRVVAPAVDAGGHDVVRAFAIHAMAVEDEIVLAFDRSSGAFAVGASENVVSVRRADDIADRIVSEAGGGGGGSEQLATGKAPPEAIEAAIETVAAELEDHLEASVHTAG